MSSSSTLTCTVRTLSKCPADLLAVYSTTYNMFMFVIVKAFDTVSQPVQNQINLFMHGKLNKIYPFQISRHYFMFISSLTFRSNVCHDKKLLTNFSASIESNWFLFWYLNFAWSFVWCLPFYRVLEFSGWHMLSTWETCYKEWMNR